MFHALSTTHLVRRGVHTVLARQAEGANGNPLVEIYNRMHAPAAVAVLLTTTILFVIVFTAVEYPIRWVIGTLAIVERTAPAGAASGDGEYSEHFEMDGLLDEADDDDDDRKADEICPPDSEAGKKKPDRRVMREAALVSGGPLTRGIRVAMGHLRAQGSWRSLYRGFRYAMFYNFLFVAIDITITTASNFHPVATMVADDIALLALIGVHCAYTHAIIRTSSSTASRKGRFPNSQLSVGWRRFVPGVWSRHLILPAARLAVSSYICSFCTWLAAKFASAASQGSSAGPTLKSISLWLLPIAVFFLSLFFIVLPALYALVRIEAALLPEGDEVVVPFDRTFGGRIDLSSGQAMWRYALRHGTIYGAWKTLGWEAYARTVRIYLKFLAVSFVIILFFALAYAFEFYFILGEYARSLVQIVQMAMEADN